MRKQTLNSSYERIYHDTYNDLLKFVIFKCNHTDEVNDIIQETYIELFLILEKRTINDIKPFIIGIAKNKIKKYFTFKSKIKKIFIDNPVDDEILVKNLVHNLNLEKKIIDKITYENIWSYLNNKNTVITKVFYLYYAEDLTIKEIAEGLKISESSVKNHLYRTIKELKELYRKEDNHE